MKGRRGWRGWLWFLGALILVVLPVTVRANDDPLTVTTDTTLTEDHQGSIVIAADDVTLDCAGHTVQGDGTGVGIGIQLDGRSGVTVNRCVVTGFSEGILVENSSGNTVAENTVRQNADRGMRLTSSNRNKLIGNAVIDNGGGPAGANGLILAGASSHNEVKFNTVTGTDSTGIPIVDGSSWNTIIGNVSSNNGDRGFDIISASHNTLFKNIVVGNRNSGFLLRGGSEHNIVRDNAACLNDPIDAADEHEVDGGMGNVWINNLFCTESIN